MTAVLPLEYVRRAEGHIRLPGSKSIANRALLLASLAKGTTRLRSVLDSDDTCFMRGALRELGVNLSESREPDGLAVTVNGLAGGFPTSSAGQHLYLGNAGTAMRPLCAVLAVSGGDFNLTGDPRMHERPIGPLVDALRSLGADITYLGEAGYPPLSIAPATLSGQEVSIDGSLSSQFVSALLIALPLRAQDTLVHLTGELVSLPYIELTLALMARFGVEVERLSARRYRVPGGRQYRSPGEFIVEGDASSASYFLAAGAIAGGPVTVTGTGRASLQGDKAFAEVLTAMGAQVSWEDNSITVCKGSLQGGSFDLNAIPDAAMTIATTALFASGPTEIRNVFNWRLKETDRLHAMATELRKTGAQVTEFRDGLRIEPPAVIQRARVATYDDHRMAMCFALLAFSPAGVDIENPQTCEKTYPDFFLDFSRICHDRV